jgi:hypothetical protein
MTHEDAGHYPEKHASHERPDKEIAAALKSAADDGGLACRSCERIAGALGRTMAEIGKAADLLEIQLCECQLGLYGHPDGNAPHGKVVAPAAAVLEDLAAAIRGALQDDRLPCAQAWAIARERGIDRMNVSAACEAIGIKIKPCQLGAF